MQSLVLHIETSNKLFKIIHLERDSQDQVLGLLTPFMKGTRVYEEVIIQVMNKALYFCCEMLLLVL